MDEEDRDLLESLRLSIVSVLHVEDVLDYLRARRILTTNDDELIRAGGTRQYRCNLLLNTLPTRGPTAFDAFVEALEFFTRDQQIVGYRPLIKKLRRRTEDISDSDAEDDSELWQKRLAAANGSTGTGDTLTLPTSKDIHIVIQSQPATPATTLKPPHPCATINGSSVHVSCEQQITDLTEQRNLAREQLAKLQREQAKFELQEKEYKELKAIKVQDDEDTKQRSLELRHALEQNYVFSRELDRVKAELAENSSEMDRLRRFQAEASACSDTSSKFRDLYTEVSVERDDLKKKLGVEQATVTELQAKIETMRSEMENLRAVAVEEHQQNANLREKLTEADIEVKFERQNSMTWKSRLHEKERRSSNKELSDLTHQYRERCEELNLAAKELKDLRLQLEITQENLQLANKVTDEVEQRCATQTRLSQELNDKCASLINDCRCLKTQLGQLSMELHELQKRKEELEIRRFHLEQDKFHREQQTESLVDLHQQWRNDMDALQQQLEKLRQERDQAKSLQLRDSQAVDGLKSKNGDLQARLKQAEYNSQAAKSELNEAKRNGIFLEYQLHQLASVVNDLTDASEINKTDQDRARLNLTLYRAVVAGQIPDGLKEVEIPADHRLPIMEVELTKTDESFGVTLESQIVVSRSLLPVAQNYRNLLLPGDRVLKVNGIAVRDQQISAIEEYLQQGPTTAKLVVFRSPTSFLTPTGPEMRERLSLAHASGVLSPVSTASSGSSNAFYTRPGPHPSNNLSESDAEDRMSEAPQFIKQKPDNITTPQTRMRVLVSQFNVDRDLHLNEDNNDEDEHLPQDSLPIRPITFFDSDLPEEEISPRPDLAIAFLENIKLNEAQIRRGRTMDRQRSLLRRSSSMSEFDRIMAEGSSMSESDEDIDADVLRLQEEGGLRLLSVSKSLTLLKNRSKKIRKRMTPDERRAFKAKHKKSKTSEWHSPLQFRKSQSFDAARRRPVVLPKGSPIPANRKRARVDFSIQILQQSLPDPISKPNDRRISLCEIDSSKIPGLRVVNIPLDCIKPMNVQLAGGRGNGIFIENVANKQSVTGDEQQFTFLKPGDQLLRLGSCDLGNATYEMAATAWKLINIASSMKRQGGRSDDDAYFAVSVRSAETAYKNLPSGVRDAFFIRVAQRVDREYVKGELQLELGALYHVVDTLFENKEGVWRAHRVSEDGSVLETGCIPSASVLDMASKMPEKLSSPRKMLDLPVQSRLGVGTKRERSVSSPTSGCVTIREGDENGRQSPSPSAVITTMTLGTPKAETCGKSRGSLEGSGTTNFMKKIRNELLKNRRAVTPDDSPTRQLTAMNGKDLGLGQQVSKPFYEVVECCKILFARPVVILGAMATQVMHQLHNDPQSSNYIKCQAASVQESEHTHTRRSGLVEFLDFEGTFQVLSAHSLVELSKKGKHVVFANVDPTVVSSLRALNLHPILLYVQVKSISGLCYYLGVESQKAIQTLNQTNALVRHHMIVTDTLELEVDVEKSDSGLFLNSIKERVAGRQNEPLWVPSAEQLPTQPLSREDIRDWLQEESLWSW